MTTLTYVLMENFCPCLSFDYEYEYYTITITENVCSKIVAKETYHFRNLNSVHFMQNIFQIPVNNIFLISKIK